MQKDTQLEYSNSKGKETAGENRCELSGDNCEATPNAPPFPNLAMINNMLSMLFKQDSLPWLSRPETKAAASNWFQQLRFSKCVAHMKRSNEMSPSFSRCGWVYIKISAVVCFLSLSNSMYIYIDLYTWKNTNTVHFCVLKDACVFLRKQVWTMWWVLSKVRQAIGGFCVRF